MIDFTLSKAQQAARDYAHQVALEEMRPISLECDRTEEIPESFFWNMQRRYWAALPLKHGLTARMKVSGRRTC